MFSGQATDNQNETYVQSPATTPGTVSSFDEHKFLVPYTVRTKKKFRVGEFLKKWNITADQIPYAILSASIFQIIFYAISNKTLQKVLRFEPSKQYELWRFLTYMLVHDDWYHLALNVLMQCLFATVLEKRHGKIRVILLYLVAGITGVLGASCVQPDLVIGASAGVYALLISNIADIILNFSTIKYKLYRSFCIAVIVFSDIIYNVVHFYSKDEPLISWGAHVVGGATGLLLGLVLFKTEKNEDEDGKVKLRNSALFRFGLLSYCFMFFTLIFITFQIKKCTPLEAIRVKYNYFC